jgi:hypothetical protein
MASDTRRAIGWLAILESPFWERIRKHKPSAMLISVLYAIVIGPSSNRCWWLAGWSSKLIDAVEEVLSESDKVQLDGMLIQPWLRSEIHCFDGSGIDNEWGPRNKMKHKRRIVGPPIAYFSVPSLTFPLM